jgi:hypothetical protein
MRSVILSIHPSLAPSEEAITTSESTVNIFHKKNGKYAAVANGMQIREL